MLESLKNIFAVADLRKRVLFTLGPARRLSRRRPHRHARHQQGGARHPRRSGEEHDVRAVRHVLGAEPVADDDLRAGHHALHQRVDHPAAADGGLAVPRAAVEGRGARPAEDHAVHALRHDPPRGRPGARHRVFPRAQHRHRRRPAARLRAGLGLPPDDGADADDRHDVRDVARRADHRARHRQRHVAHHLRRDRRRAADGRHHDPRSAEDRADGAHPPRRCCSC